ncbi:hypothetical protein NG726_02710 [Pseudomonas sp. MOB-449]|nr:hypothetical protein [Pseudomonas sp. MOB-449]
MKRIKAFLLSLRSALPGGEGAVGENREALVPIRIGRDLLLFVPREADRDDALVGQLKGLGHW